MESRMNKYYTEEIKKEAKRTTKNAPLYRQIYGAYDEFENYKLPVETNEIDITNIKKNITSREEYRKMKEYGNITNKNTVVMSDTVPSSPKKDPRIYDVNELLSKALLEKKDTPEDISSMKDYLHTLQTDEEIKTDLEKVKEMYEKIRDEVTKEEEPDTSLDLLSDLKSENGTEVMPPFKDEETSGIKITKEDYTKEKDFSKTFYGDKNEFSKDDFNDDNFYDDELIKNHYLLKSILVLILIFAIVAVTLYMLNRYGVVDITKLYAGANNG